MSGFRGRSSLRVSPFLVIAVVVALLVANRGDGGKVVYPTAPGDASTARVERVVDGDTVRLRGIGSVRLIGVDTPEVYGHVECFGPEASRYVKGLLPPGSPVRYSVGAEPRDRYGRLLAYVYLPDGGTLNRLLVTGGYATVLTIAPNDRYARAFGAAERAARAAHAGMWGRPHCENR
jgi:micrococcal nuclease